MSFKWRNAGLTLNADFVIFQGIQTSIAKKPYIFVIFQGGALSSPLDPHMDD